MFEAARYLDSEAPDVDASVLLEFRQFRDNITARSLIAWGEHCSECAAPACYSNCSYYTPRFEDFNCGRFAQGIRKGRFDGDVRVATIQFRKWGKLEGRGPAALFPLPSAERWETANDVITQTISLIAPSPIVPNLKWRWDNFKRQQFAKGSLDPDAFAVEAWLPADAAADVTLTLTIVPVEDEGKGLFQDILQLHPGYNRLEIPIERIRSRVDLHAPYFLKIEPLADTTPQSITFGMLDFVTFRERPAALKARQEAPAAQPAVPAVALPKIKCVVWDLDNTLWKGTLTEDGPDALVLNSQAVEVIKELDRRGILHSIASKNDMEPVMEVLKSFGLADYFLYPQVSWNPKSTAVKRIAELLDIGLDTFVLIDDQPFERAEVGESIPAVRVLDETDLHELLEHSWFDVPVTPESGNRRSMYQAEELRKSVLEGSAGDYLEFLRGCNLTVDAYPINDEVLERAYELSQRTNQLNTSGQRYEKEELRAICLGEDPRQAFVFRCSDRFGDYGYIALCVLQPETAEVQSYMMSCRVQRKKVENAIFAWLLNYASDSGAQQLRIRYRKTARNTPSLRMLQDLGFEFDGDEESGWFHRSVNAPVEDSEVVTLTDHIRG